MVLGICVMVVNSLGLIATVHTIMGGDDPEIGIDAYQKACQFTSSGSMLLTGGSDGERVKGWSVPELRFISSIMPDRDDFIVGDEILDIATAKDLVEQLHRQPCV